MLLLSGVRACVSLRLAALQNLVEAFVKYTAKFVLDNHVQDLRAIQRWQDNEREVAAKQVSLPAPPTAAAAISPHRGQAKAGASDENKRVADQPAEERLRSLLEQPFMRLTCTPPLLPACMPAACLPPCCLYVHACLPTRPLQTPTPSRF